MIQMRRGGTGHRMFLESIQIYSDGNNRSDFDNREVTTIERFLQTNFSN